MVQIFRSGHEEMYCVNKHWFQKQVPRDIIKIFKLIVETPL